MIEGCVCTKAPVRDISHCFPFRIQREERRMSFWAQRFVCYARSLCAHITTDNQFCLIKTYNSRAPPNTIHTGRLTTAHCQCTYNTYISRHLFAKIDDYFEKLSYYNDQKYMYKRTLFIE